MNNSQILQELLKECESKLTAFDNVYANKKELDEFIVKAFTAGQQEERKSLLKVVEEAHQELREELKGTGVDNYSINYKHGIVRGYTLIGRYLLGR